MIMYFNPIKVLMPLALTLLVVGALKAVFDIVRYAITEGSWLYISTNAVLLVLTGLIIAAVALLADLIVRSRPDT